MRVNVQLPESNLFTKAIHTGPFADAQRDVLRELLHRRKILSRIQVRGQKFLENSEIVKDLAHFRRGPVSALFYREPA